MSLNLLTRLFLFILVLILPLNVVSQVTEEEVNSTENKKEGTKIYISTQIDLPIASGDKYIGLAMKGKSGFQFRLQGFVYKGIFIGGAVGATYFKVKNTELVGNYERTNINYSYLFAGYEFISTENINAGISIGFFGDADYVNRFEDNIAKQKDQANVFAYEGYIDYAFEDGFSVLLNVSYRNDKTKIQTAPEIQARFDRAQFINIGIGLRYRFTHIW
jgi:hypothetical protein